MGGGGFGDTTGHGPGGFGAGQGHVQTQLLSPTTSVLVLIKAVNNRASSLMRRILIERQFSCFALQFYLSLVVLPLCTLSPVQRTGIWSKRQLYRGSIVDDIVCTREFGTRTYMQMLLQRFLHCTNDEFLLITTTRTTYR